MNLRLLEIFCCVYRQRSFSRAAEELELTQPTISAHIKSLEEYFDAPLFDRLGRRIEPTPAGRFLYRHGERILKMKEHALESMGRFLNRLEGELRIGASTVPGEFMLPSVIGEFRRAYPGIRVQLRIGDTRGIARRVADGEVELGFVGGSWEDPDLEFSPWKEDPLILVAPGSEARSRVGLDEFQALPLLARESGSGTRMAFERRLAEVGVDAEECTVVAELGSTTAIIEGVRAGVGASFLSEVSVRRLVAAGELRRLEVKGLPDSRRVFYRVVATRRAASPLRPVFLEFL